MAHVQHTWCRAFGHAWDPSDVVEQGGTFDVTIKCGRCTTSRSFRLTRRGERDGGNRYRYPKGYLVKGGVDKDTVRLTALGLGRG